MRLHFNRMSILIPPLCFLILLGLASFLISRACMLAKQFEHDEVLQAHELRNRSVSEVEHTARMIVPLNSSATNLARYLSSSLNGTELSFSTVQAKIAPSLFQALLTIPDVTEVGYNGLDALAFSYFKEDQKTFARFSNSSESSLMYTQPVNLETGKLFGEATSSNSTKKLIVTTFERGPEGVIPYHSLEVGHNGNDLLFTNTVPMDGRGEISINIPAQKAIEYFSHLDLHGGQLHLVANGKVLIETILSDAEIAVDNQTLSLKWKKPNGDYDKVTNASCISDDGQLGNFAVKIKENQHEFYCSTVKLAGVDSVYVLTFRLDGMETAARRHYILAIVLLVLMLLGIIFSLCLFFFLILKAARREIVLCDALIKQKESTQQAERKSMSMSYAFATNSQDLRASLKTITVLVEECREDVITNSQLMTNLTRINAYVQDLLGLLNTVLDQSKIEADKIKLKDEEFNLTQVLEEVVDMFYPLGIRKGVDVMLDPCDGSILKFSQVRGDKERLRQILLNLLSNATKFTSDGHVVIRTTVRKTSRENAIIASNRRSLLTCLSKLCHRSSGSSHSADTNIHTVHQNPNCKEFIFEVDDTGCGIPKERQKCVFENYVQVKTHDSEEKGWGLGLGIVQSLVRMMGGEIKIVDKESGERGSCFRFNIFLATRNPVSADIDGHGNHTQSGGSSVDLWNYFGLHIRSPSPRLEGSHVVLLLDGNERRKISRAFIENVGIKVSVAKTSNELMRILHEMGQKLEYMQPSLPKKYESRSASNSSSSGPRDGCSSGTKDGQDSSSPQRKNLNSKCSTSFVLILIDSVAGTSLEVNSVLSSLKKESRNFQCKIMWWENPFFRVNNSRQPNKDLSLPPHDYVLSKPLHGSVLFEVLGLLPEFQGAFQTVSFKIKAEEAEVEESDDFIELVPSKRYVQFSGDDAIQICDTSSNQKQELQEIVIHEQTADQGPSRPLQGKTVLIVDDDGVLRKITGARLSQLGAKVDVCENGKDALDLVCRGLNDQAKIHPKALPYDYIFMDCQMPVVDGYEATRLIRKEEKLHGVRIPIFALTFNTLDEENTKQILDAGMDYHLSKPFKVDKLMEAITSVEHKMKA